MVKLSQMKERMKALSDLAIYTKDFGMIFIKFIDESNINRLSMHYFDLLYPFSKDLAGGCRKAIRE
jgi:hypothetical protein